MKRILSLVLAVVFTVGCMCVPTVSAAGTETEAPVWHLNPPVMSSATDNSGSAEYTLEATNTTLTNVSLGDYNDKALYINDGQYAVNDTKGVMDNYPTFEISGDFFFDSFPSGTYKSSGVTYSADPTAENFYSQSVIAWVRATSAAGTGSSFNGIRMDCEGNLYSGNSVSTALGVKLEEDTWYNIRLVYMTEERVCELIIDGKHAALIGVDKNYESKMIRLYDRRFDYKTYVKNLTIAAHNTSYTITGEVEESADFVSYQTTKVTGGKFDMRIVSGVDSLKYRNFGYDVYVISKDANGAIQVKEFSEIGRSVYSEIYGGETKYSVKDNFGYKYACLATLKNLDATSKYTELILRPYTMSEDHNKKYGKATTMQYVGVGDEGYPEFRIVEKLGFSVVASDDAKVRNGKYANENYGALTSLKVKNSNSDFKRDVYIKFPLTEDIKNNYVEGTSVINLSLFASYSRTLSATESAAGGYVMQVYKAGNDWSEDTVTFNNAPAKQGLVTSFRMNGEKTYDVDVTDAVVAAIDAGEDEVTFCLSSAVSDGSLHTTFYSKESSGINKPQLSIKNTEMPYVLNLQKTGNEGYEPWGYAQKLVDEWESTGRELAYANTHDAFNVGNMNGISKVSIATENGAHTVPIKGSSSSPNPNYKDLYARTIDSLVENGGYTVATGDEVTKYDSYGGIVNSGLTGATATGFFHVDTLSDGRMYLIDPLGNPFFVTAVNSINAGTTTAQKNYVTEVLGKTEEQYWADMTADLREIGINAATGSFDSISTQGDTSLNGIVSVKGISGYMGTLGLSTSTGGQSSFKYNDSMNVFDPDFIKYTENANKPILEKYKNDPRVIGYTSDNELPRRKDMLDAYLTLDPTVVYNAFSYATAWTWMMEKTGKTCPALSDITDELREEFKAFVFSALFKTVSGQINKYDGNHMYIGTRANGTNRNSEGYLRAAGVYCGMLTLNMYDGLEPSGDIIEAIYKYAGKPFIVTEFYSKAQDAYGLNGELLANQANAGFLVPTQEDRAVYYQNYTLLLLESKYCVGWVWYRFQDNDQSLYKIVTADGKTFENLRTWTRGDGHEIATFIKEGCVDAGASNENLITLEIPTAVRSTAVPYSVDLTYTDESGAKVETTGTISWIYVGETDTSNLGSNKGIVDDKMNFYEPLAEAITLIGDNIFSLIDYFDNVVNAGE